MGVKRTGDFADDSVREPGVAKLDEDVEMMCLGAQREPFVTIEDEFSHNSLLERNTCAAIVAAMPKSTKKLRSNHAWIERHINDPFVKKSRAEGYRARSAYKLIELDEREKMFRPGVTVVDLGSAPGSWTQVARARLSDTEGNLVGRIVAMDILPMDPVDGAIFLQGDFREQSVADELAKILDGDKVDVVMSDMAPNLSGVAMVDAAASIYLNELAVEFAREHMKSTGIFVTKAFQGSGYSQFIELCKKTFKSVAQRKPEASRDTSAEMYVVGRGLKAT